jgi:hypothetical protein
MKDNSFKHDDFKKLAPMLFSMPKKNTFKVPEGYFEELPLFIQNRLDGESKPSFWNELYKAVFKPQTAWGAASIVALIVTGLLINNSQNNIIVNSQDIAEVLYHDEMNNIDEEIFVEVLSEESLVDEKQTVSNILNDDEIIIDYLIDNDIDESDIINELSII